MEAATITPNALRFNHTPEQMETLADDMMARGEKTFSEVIGVEADKRNWANQMLPIARFESFFSTSENNITFYRYVSTNKELRDKAVAIEEKLDAWSIKQDMRHDLYVAFEGYRTFAEKSGEWDKLSDEQQRFVNKLILGKTRNGLGLDEATRDQVAKVKQEITDLERKASQLINEDKTKVKCAKSDLDGFSEDQIAKLEKVEGSEETHVYISMKYPEVIPALRLVKNGEVRKALDKARGEMCLKENSVILQDLVVLRQKLAELLGYTSYSNYILEVRMAGNAKTVQKFEEDLTRNLMKKGKKEFEDLQELKREELKDPEAKLEGWDRMYFENVQKQRFFKVDEDEIKQYFPMTNVTAETLKIYQELLSLTFTKLEGVQVWHEDVETYEVKDAESEQLLGHFYLDLFPRENKYNHAAVFPMIKRNDLGGEGDVYQPSAAAMVCNFDKPTADKPSCMYHGDVVTFFHEFGHVMHNMCTTSNFARFSGTSVERDFVELPSQMLENWMWNEEILARVSKHVDTGVPLPSELIKKKLAIKNLNEAYFTLNQIFYGTFDFVLHSAYDKELLAAPGPADASEYSLGNLRRNIKKEGEKIDTGALWAQLKPVFNFTQQQEGTNPAASFGHIFGGYQSQYYGYLWSQVFSCDLFACFEKEGVMNATLGKKYRELILAPGGSVDSEETLREFLGRDPNDEAFMRMNGFDKA